MDVATVLPRTGADSERFERAFAVAAVLCAIGAVVAMVLLPRRRREPVAERVEAIALVFTRCRGAPYCGHLARVVVFGHRMRDALGGPRRAPTPRHVTASNPARAGVDAGFAR